MKDSKGKKESGIGFWAKAIATTLVILILAFGFGAFCYTKTVPYDMIGVIRILKERGFRLWSHPIIFYIKKVREKL